MKVWLLVCMVLLVACQPPGSSTTPAAVTARNGGDLECPDGKPARPGLQNFGAYIGTWAANRPHDRSVTTDYAIGIVPGHVAVRCTNDGFVVVERIHPQFQMPAGTAVRVALSDLPEDSDKVYDHTHASCRVLQYRSQLLSQQLRAADDDGSVDIVFTSETSTYNAAAVKTIVLDLYDKLGADTRAC